MAIGKEVLDELLKDFKNPQEMVGDEFLKELKKAIVERAMEAELTAQLGYEKGAFQNLFSSHLLYVTGIRDSHKIS